MARKTYINIKARGVYNTEDGGVAIFRVKCDYTNAYINNLKKKLMGKKDIILEGDIPKIDLKLSKNEKDNILTALEESVNDKLYLEYPLEAREKTTVWLNFSNYFTRTNYKENITGRKGRVLRKSIGSS